MKATAIATPLVAAIELAWSKIQEEHPDVPDVVVTLGSGIVRAGLKYGHFAASAWERNGEDAKVHELFVGGEGLTRGAQALMGTLLHEAAHAYAEANEVKDTSRQGRYHNDKFRLIAETFGLKLTHSATLGWSTTEMPDETAALYEEAIFTLDLALTAHRHMPLMVQLPTTPGTTTITTGTTRRTTSNGRVSVHCNCNRRLWLAPSTLMVGGITCNVCGAEFTE